MRISHLGHSAVLLQTDEAQVLIDPGNFSDDWHGLTDLDAVLITHQHPDHADPEHLPALAAANPNARILVEPSIVDKMSTGEFPDARRPPPSGRAIRRRSATCWSTRSAVGTRSSTPTCPGSATSGS